MLLRVDLWSYSPLPDLCYFPTRWPVKPHLASGGDPRRGTNEHEVEPAEPTLLRVHSCPFGIAFPPAYDFGTDPKPHGFAQRTAWHRFLLLDRIPTIRNWAWGARSLSWSSQGHRLHLVDMTNGEPTPQGSPESRARESAAAAKVRGGADAPRVDEPPGRALGRDRHKLAAVIRNHRADWLFVPYPIDARPDHVAATKSPRTRFDAKLTKSSIPGEPCYPKRMIYYFCTHLRMNLHTDFCIDVSGQIERSCRR